MHDQTLTQNRITSDYVSSFERSLFDRIKASNLIALISALPSKSLLRTSYEDISNILPESKKKNRDKLLESVNGHLSWSDIGNYFSNLAAELGLDKIFEYSSPMFRELSLYWPSEQGELMSNIVEARAQTAPLLEANKLRKDNDTYEDVSNSRNLVRPNEISQKIKPITKPRHTDDKQNYYGNDASLYYSAIRHRGNVGFNPNTLLRLSWSDIGSYFSKLVVDLGLVQGDDLSRRDGLAAPHSPTQYEYVNMRLGIPGEVRKIGKAKKFLKGEPEYVKKGAVEASDDDKKSYHNYLNLAGRSEKITSPGINIITDNSLNELPGKYNVDALTIGPNIIFAKDKFDLNSPQGIALLIHELTHIHQLEGLPNFHSDYYNNTVSSSMKAWEQEALEKEQYVYDQLSFSDKTSDEATGGFHRDYSNIRTLDERVEFDKRSSGFTSKYPATGPSFVVSNTSLSLGKFIPKQVSDTYPELSFANNLNSIHHNVNSTNTSTPNDSNHMNSSMVPLLADQSRNLETSSSKKEGHGTGPVQPPWVSNPFQSVNPASTSFDIETIAEKVYQIFQRKIKIQRARRGIG